MEKKHDALYKRRQERDATENKTHTPATSRGQSKERKAEAQKEAEAGEAKTTAGAQKTIVFV